VVVPEATGVPISWLSMARAIQERRGSRLECRDIHGAEDLTTRKKQKKRRLEQFELLYDFMENF